MIWRFLQLRGYVDDKHKLTVWGKCLEQALSNVDPVDNLEDAIFIAIEMIRMDLLNTQQWFSHVSGGPMRGSGKFDPMLPCLRMIGANWPVIFRGRQVFQHAGFTGSMYCEITA